MKKIKLKKNIRNDKNCILYYRHAGYGGDAHRFVYAQHVANKDYKDEDDEDDEFD